MAVAYIRATYVEGPNIESFFCQLFGVGTFTVKRKRGRWQYQIPRKLDAQQQSQLMSLAAIEHYEQI
ncbi:hypothetical protein HYQ45_008479 [Verticillium longisporum]|uniref:Uncharacterized protein n=2 Tax=Verticillium TaxID=1036719 RepID=A0A8I2ZM60_VERLO|nr:hypothetical protein HYQ44_005800 [Verticillium longisporum]KAG7133331.1 hypothetical protein HYQ45_008479 [Verticillium longisporum]KAG7151369.1 hypothetical protein HYQ46_012854 [Verticillium longisporum]RXG41519.1 hypothetical protein VDGE_30811 [Verticillium dahliae]